MLERSLLENIISKNDVKNDAWALSQDIMTNPH